MKRSTPPSSKPSTCSLYRSFASSKEVGPALFFSVYLASISLAGGAAILIFTVQHNFEHSYASDSESWDGDEAVLHGTSFLALPSWLNWFTANIGYHHIHHLSPRIPNYHLRAAHESLPEIPGLCRLSLRSSFACARLKLWCEERQCMVDFSGVGTA
jgi:omega-6 fatty acid desaturase (delta-12 desaturase)